MTSLTPLPNVRRSHSDRVTGGYHNYCSMRTNLGIGLFFSAVCGNLIPTSSIGLSNGAAAVMNMVQSFVYNDTGNHGSGTVSATVNVASSVDSGLYCISADNASVEFPTMCFSIPSLSLNRLLQMSIITTVLARI